MVGVIVGCRGAACYFLSWGCRLFRGWLGSGVFFVWARGSFLLVAWEFSFGGRGIIRWLAWGCRLFCGWLGSGMGRSVRWRLVARARSTAARQGFRLGGRGHGRVRLARKRLIGVGELVDLGKLVGWRGRKSVWLLGLARPQRRTFAPRRAIPVSLPGAGVGVFG